MAVQVFRFLEYRNEERGTSTGTRNEERVRGSDADAIAIRALLALAAFSLSFPVPLTSCGALRALFANYGLANCHARDRYRCCCRLLQIAADCCRLLLAAAVPEYPPSVACILSGSAENLSSFCTLCTYSAKQQAPSTKHQAPSKIPGAQALLQTLQTLQACQKG